MILLLILLAGAAVLVAYLGLIGVLLPAAAVLLLGHAWEWDPDAWFYVIFAGFVVGAAFAAGVARRWRRRLRASS